MSELESASFSGKQGIAGKIGINFMERRDSYRFHESQLNGKIHLQKVCIFWLLHGLVGGALPRSMSAVPGSKPCDDLTEPL